MVDQLHFPIDLPDKHGRTALHYGCSANDVEVVDFLITNFNGDKGARRLYCSYGYYCKVAIYIEYTV